MHIAQRVRIHFSVVYPPTMQQYQDLKLNRFKIRHCKYISAYLAIIKCILLGASCCAFRATAHLEHLQLKSKQFLFL
jgi:hypothetical protein